MIRRKQAIALAAGGALAAGVVFAAAGSAAPGAPHLTNVPTPNTKSDGYAPVSKLSPELRQVVVAQGSTRLENPSALTAYYGYDNDTLNSAGEPVSRPPPTRSKRTRPSRTRTRI